MNKSAKLETRGRKTGGGFSLLETLVAVTIFSIAIVALIEGIAASTRAQAWIESENRAIMFAQNILEEIEYVSDLRAATDTGEFPDENGRFSWSSQVLETDLEGLYEVHVVISWMEGQAERAFELVTYLRMREEDETTELQY
ncbi:hypothetical protein AMJ85_07905 [candidate division BRC1 bacterium SM23_51]|nr:MAG: hypothetical protein AMJ85_07905 [candidate division BRC1 bacterium SM23_51]